MLHSSNLTTPLTLTDYTSMAALLLPTLTLLFATFSSVQSCPSHEWASLMAFKAALNEPHLRIFRSWRGTNCCYNWYGISCDPNTHRVAEISLRGLGDDWFFKRAANHTGYMTGSISPAICNLTQLSSVTISDWKGISGIIPRCITSLSFLRIIDLSGNVISGQIPRDIWRLTQLTMLNLADNHISGNIPRSLVHLSNLMHLDLRNNAIGGPIPWNFGKLTMLSRALLSDNRITGRIPWTISRIYRLADLDLSLNRISGIIPESLGRMPVLDTLNLKYNNISGRIPWTLLSSRMSHLDLSRNSLSGRIPNAFREKTYFTSLDLSHNRLKGSIAKSMTSAMYIGHLDLSHNLLCGKIPSGAPFDHLQASSFDHNECLCGRPLTKPCRKR